MYVNGCWVGLDPPRQSIRFFTVGHMGMNNTDGRGGNATPSPALSLASRELFQSRCGRYASCEGGGRAAGFCTLVPAIASAWWGKPHPAFTYTIAGKVYVNGESSTSMAEAGTLPPPQPSPAADATRPAREGAGRRDFARLFPQLRRSWRGKPHPAFTYTVAGKVYVNRAGLARQEGCLYKHRTCRQ